MGYSLGVDLGTTYTAAAVSREGKVEIVPLGGRAPQVPSVAYRTEQDGFLFGEPAERHAITDPERVAREFKRRIGDRTSIIIGGTPMSAHALSRAMLAWVVGVVAAGQGAPPDRLTVTYPANWGPFRRELLDQVTAISADFPVGVCTEPEAAAVHFADSGRLSSGQVVAVYDLGGGTFDATVLRRTDDGLFELLGSPDGIEQLGGRDFDDAVVGWVVQVAGLQGVDTDDPRVISALARLRRDCVEAKEALSAETEVTIPVGLDGAASTVRLTRSELDGLIRPLVVDTVDSLERAVRHAGLAPHELSAVLLAGGSARVPLVSELVTQRLGRPVVVTAQPKLCVAMGAALVGAARAGAGQPPGAPSPVTAGTGSAPEADRVGSVPVTFVADPEPKPSEVATPVPVTAATTPPQQRSRRRPPRYRYATGGLAVVALLLALLGPTAKPAGGELTWGEGWIVSARGWPESTRLVPTLLGLPLPPFEGAVAIDGQFDLRPYRVLLGGPVQARVTAPEAPSSAVLVSPDAWESRRLLTVPFGALVLALLFASAYVESLLRGLRRGRRPVTPSEVVGLIWAGAVCGVAVVLATWIFASRLLEVWTAVAVVMVSAVAVAMLAFGWAGRPRSVT